MKLTTHHHLHAPHGAVLPGNFNVIIELFDYHTDNFMPVSFVESGMKGLRILGSASFLFTLS
jgi:hypothetical protein